MPDRDIPAGELRRGPGVRVVAVAEHRDIDEVSRRGTLPDLGVDVRQIDPLINPAPDPVFAGIGNFRRAIGCGHAIAVRSTRSWRRLRCAARRLDRLIFVINREAVITSPQLGSCFAIRSLDDWSMVS
jgi:hypothetical protein